MVQEGVVIVEDVPFGDGIIAVVVSEFRQRPIGDILLSVCPVLHRRCRTGKHWEPLCGM